MKGRAGVKLQPKPVKALGHHKPRSDGIWGFNHAQTVETLELLSSLLLQREEIKDLLRYKVIPLVKMIETRSGGQGSGREKLSATMRKTVEQLVVQGYVGVFPKEYEKYFPFLGANEPTPVGLKKLVIEDNLGDDEAEEENGL